MTIQEKKLANEKFFLDTLRNLSENGIYIFPAGQAFYKKKNGKFHASPKDLVKIQDLVTPEFFQKYFTIE